MEMTRLVDAGWEAARWTDREGVTVAPMHQLTQAAPRLRGCACTLTPPTSSLLSKLCAWWGVIPRNGYLGYNSPQGPQKNRAEQISPGGSPRAGLSTFHAPQGSGIGPHPVTSGASPPGFFGMLIVRSFSTQAAL